MKKIKVSIPFPGFYESMLSAEIDDQIRREIEYQNEVNNEELCDLDYCIDYHAIYVDIAKRYTGFYIAWMIEKTGIALQFEFINLFSPYQYNFSTDEIECAIRPLEIRLLLNWLNTNAGPHYFRDFIFDRLKPYSGFIPFYSNNLTNWGTFDTWDGAQLSLVLEALSNYLEDGVEFYETAEGSFIENYLQTSYSVVDHMKRLLKGA